MYMSMYVHFDLIAPLSLDKIRRASTIALIHVFRSSVLTAADQRLRFLAHATVTVPPIKAMTLHSCRPSPRPPRPASGSSRTDSLWCYGSWHRHRLKPRAAAAASHSEAEVIVEPAQLTALPSWFGVVYKRAPATRDAAHASSMIFGDVTRK